MRTCFTEVSIVCSLRVCSFEVKIPNEISETLTRKDIDLLQKHVEQPGFTPSTKQVTRLQEILGTSGKIVCPEHGQEHLVLDFLMKAKVKDVFAAVDEAQAAGLKPSEVFFNKLFRRK